MCSPTIPVLRFGAHLSPGLPPCSGPLLFYGAPPGCFWPAYLSLSLRGPRQGCNTVVVRLLSEDMSNESPSPSSYLFAQLHYVSSFQSLSLLSPLGLLSLVHTKFSRSNFLSSTVFLGGQLTSSAPEFPCGFRSGASCCVPLGPQDSVDCL